MNFKELKQFVDLHHEKISSIRENLDKDVDVLVEVRDPSDYKKIITVKIGGIGFGFDEENGKFIMITEHPLTILDVPLSDTNEEDQSLYAELQKLLSTKSNSA